MIELYERQLSEEPHRMKKYSTPFDAKKIKRIFENKGLHNVDVFTYDITDSTNTRAKLYAKNEGKAKRAPAVFVARGQDAGRGTRGRTFNSLAGVGLYVSFLFYPDALGAEVTAITSYAATRVIKALDELVEDRARLGIKWVNDVYLDGRKLAGILTEGELDSECRFSFAICGIGINLYRRVWQPELEDIAISLEEAGVDADPEALLISLSEEFFSSLSEAGSPSVHSEYVSRSLLLGEPVSVTSADGSYDATATRINPDFSLSVTTPDGTEKRLISADVSVRKNKNLGGF